MILFLAALLGNGTDLPRAPPGYITYGTRLVEELEKLWGDPTVPITMFPPLHTRGLQHSRYQEHSKFQNAHKRDWIKYLGQWGITGASRHQHHHHFRNKWTTSELS